MLLPPKLAPWLQIATSVLFYPLFILLHATFIVSSLVLRTYQTFTAPQPTFNSDFDCGPRPDPSSNSNSSTALGQLHGDVNDTAETSENRRTPPKHLGLVLVPSRRPGQIRKERDALVHSILRASEWAAGAGIIELSVWDGQGLAQSALPSLMRQLNLHQTDLPLSPPSSSPSTPPLRPMQDETTISPPDNPSPRVAQGGTQREPRALIGEEGEDDETKTDASAFEGQMDKIGGVTSLTVYPQSHGHTRSARSSKGLTIHLLPPSSSGTMISSLTRRYAEMGEITADINVQSVDRDIKEQLGFDSHPDILLIHHLSQPSLVKRLLPRRAPELWGYPFWALRITEIYQYPTPLPISLTSPFFRLIRTLRSSSLPFLRKMGYFISVPPPPSSYSYRSSSSLNRLGLGTGADLGSEHRALPAHGVLDKVEWEGMMGAWDKVEQRLGR